MGVVHEVSFHEFRNIEPKTIRCESMTEIPTTEVDLVLRLNFGRLVAEYRWERSCGAPERPLRPIPTLEIAGGQWGRLILNGRFAPERTWTYQGTIFNIGIPEDPDGDPFPDAPAAVADARADLW
jgi:hypothetical protein